MESHEARLRSLTWGFGRVAPGAEGTGTLATLLPVDTPTGRISVDLVFHEANGYMPASREVVFDIRPLPRREFLLRSRLVDDNSGSSVGNGDRKAEPGEGIDLETTIENRTGEPIEDVSLLLRPTEDRAGLVVNIPRVSLGTVKDGASACGRVSFGTKPSTPRGSCRFELRVESGDGRVFAVQPVDVEIQ